MKGNLEVRAASSDPDIRHLNTRMPKNFCRFSGPGIFIARLDPRFSPGITPIVIGVDKKVFLGEKEISLATKVVIISDGFQSKKAIAAFKDPEEVMEAIVSISARAIH